MRTLGPLTEAEAVLEFLRGEAGSPRFRAKLAPSLEALGGDWSLIEAGDPADAAQARLRRDLLWAYRGPSGPAPLLEGFPADVAWERVGLTPEELLEVRYTRYPYWMELSGGTRSPLRAAERIRAGVQPVPGPATSTFTQLAELLCQGLRPPPPILVGASRAGALVVLEGHSRLTAYALRPDCAPAEVEAVLGVSGRMAEWVLY
ncbi:MAG TPA: hypothetical protein VMM12_13535 [Longimicrobiales bacterium]|nr:hypothetical protein [Longimicrobiales bacterium]